MKTLQCLQDLRRKRSLCDRNLAFLFPAKLMGLDLSARLIRLLSNSLFDVDLNDLRHVQVC